MNNAMQQPGADAFQAFTNANDLTDLIYDYDYLSGLLLALVSAPDFIEPDEWLSQAFIDEHEEMPVTLDVLQLLLDQLGNIWNSWAEQLDAEDGPLALPAHYGLVDGQPSAALSRFCAGIAHGYDWLENDWNDFFDMMDGSDDLEEMEALFGGTLASAMILASPEIATEVMVADDVEPLGVEEAFDLLGDGLFVLGKLGRMAAELDEDDSEGYDDED